MTPQIAVQLTKVHKSFRRRQGLLSEWHPKSPKSHALVLQGIDLSIAAGEIAALQGANGSGKTTLLKIIAGLIEPDSGGRKIKGSFFYVPADDHSFYERLTGLENLRFMAMLKNYPALKSKRLIEEIAVSLDIPFLETRVQEFSTGMRQKLSLARALLMEPSILLLDEPWRSLDRAYSTMVKDKIIEWMQRKNSWCILYTTHQEHELGWADKQLYLKNGQLYAEEVVL